jgi:hypothetical protein
MATIFVSEHESAAVFERVKEAFSDYDVLRDDNTHVECESEIDGTVLIIQVFSVIKKAQWQQYL